MIPEEEDPEFDRKEKAVSNEVRKFLKEKNISAIDMIRLLIMNFNSTNNFIVENDMFLDYREAMTRATYKYGPFRLACSLSQRIGEASRLKSDGKEDEDSLSNNDNDDDFVQPA